MGSKDARPNWVRPPGPVARGLRIGLLGGSFNPAHSGHRHASETALCRLGLDYVWWLVSPQNPLKSETGMEDFSNRLAAARAFPKPRRIVVTGIEAELGTRFTIDTVHALQRRFPGVHFVWLMGSDNLVQFPRWRRWQAIFAALPIAVVARPGSALHARVSKPAIRFKDRQIPPDRGFALARPPAWTILDIKKRSAESATAIRASRKGRGYANVAIAE
jgi:nicotinate-nucleotide adenylyltransferase